MVERRKASSTFDNHGSTARRKGMSPRGEWIFNVASSIVILLTASPIWAQDPPKSAITVFVEPHTASFVEGADLTFRFSITNKSRNDTLSFGTCPPPYDVELFDVQGKPLPMSENYQKSMREGTYVCVSSLMVEIRPNQMWGPEEWPTPDRTMFDLRPGAYSGRLLWHFSVYKNGATYPRDVKERTIPSNSFQFTVTPRR